MLIVLMFKIKVWLSDASAEQQAWHHKGTDLPIYKSTCLSNVLT